MRLSTSVTAVGTGTIAMDKAVPCAMHVAVLCTINDVAFWRVSSCACLHLRHVCMYTTSVLYVTVCLAAMLMYDGSSVLNYEARTLSGVKNAAMTRAWQGIRGVLC